MLVSANKILAPESTRTRRVLAAPPTVVTDGESVVVVKIEAEVEVETTQTKVSYPARGIVIIERET